MPSYFKPLRRKIGVLTLVRACVLMVGWLRCLYEGDVFCVKVNGHLYSVHSTKAIKRLLEHHAHDDFDVAKISAIDSATRDGHLEFWLPVRDTRPRPSVN
jgi:hypothetical protein